MSTATIERDEEIVIERNTPVPSPVPWITEYTDVCGDSCNMVWRKFDGQLRPTLERFEYGLMFDVTFKHVPVPGCFGKFQGHAQGQLVEGVTPTTQMRRSARKLYFDECGTFRDKLTNVELKTASMLILKHGLHSAYIP